MIGINDYIIHVDGAFKDKVQAGSIELYVDKRISRDRASNRIGKVINAPALNHENAIPIGNEVMFDATALYQQIYKGVTQDSAFIVDAEKSWYKLRPSMIVMYKTSEGKWRGFEDNLMVKKLDKPKVKTSLLLLDKVEEDNCRAMIKYGNDQLYRQGVVEGMDVYIRDGFGVPFFIDGETYYWVRTKDVIAL